MSTTPSSLAKRILMIVANPAVSPVTGWPIGFWAAELAHPWVEFADAGYQVEMASPAGGKVAVDGYSDPRDASGYSAHDIISLGVLSNPRMVSLLEKTKALAELDAAVYDAIFVCGGQGPMVTFVGAQPLLAKLGAFYDAGKIVAVVCHGACVLLEAKSADGALLVDGKTWTGFANSEEDFADQVVGTKVQPFRIEDRAKLLPNTNFITDSRFKPFAIRDGRLITGQQQYSGAAAARLVVEALGV